MDDANDIERTADDALISEPSLSQTKDIEISSQAKDIERKRKHKQAMEAIEEKAFYREPSWYFNSKYVTYHTLLCA